MLDPLAPHADAIRANLTAIAAARLLYTVTEAAHRDTLARRPEARGRAVPKWDREHAEAVNAVGAAREAIINAVMGETT